LFFFDFLRCLRIHYLSVGSLDLKLVETGLFVYMDSPLEGEDFENGYSFLDLLVENWNFGSLAGPDDSFLEFLVRLLLNASPCLYQDY